MRNKNIATLALMVSGVGSCLTLSSAHWFGQLLHHGFVAATVGGLADWFAVTALFRKPLGFIGFRAEVLRRNRERIMEAIVTFAADDMLSPQNIMARLNDEDTARLFITYLQERGGRERVKDAVSSALLLMANTIEPQKIAAVLIPTAKAGLDNFAGQKIFLSLLDLLAEPKHSRPLLISLLQISREILLSPTLQQFLLTKIRNFRHGYEGNSAGRAFVLATLDLSDEKILSLLNERAETYLTAALNGDNAALTTLTQGFTFFLQHLRQDAGVETMLSQVQSEYLRKLDINTPLVDWLKENFQGEKPFWLEPLRSFIDAQMDEFATNTEWQGAFDRLAKNFLQEEITKHHGAIKDLMRDKLADFSDDKLTDFVEGRVADDLQMIRINGSVVGGIVGMGLYALVYWLERLYGI